MPGRHDRAGFEQDPMRMPLRLCFCEWPPMGAKSNCKKGHRCAAFSLEMARETGGWFVPNKLNFWRPECL